MGWQITGLALLLGGLGLGEAVLARRAGMDRNVVAERILLLTMMGGFLGAPFWWRGDPEAFAWSLPPLAGRMLAAAGWAFAAACLLVLRRPEGGQVRLAGVLLAIYLGPLTLAILALHLDRFDPARAVTYGFFGIVILLLAGAGWLILSQRQPVTGVLPSGTYQAILAAVGLAAGLWGAVLFLWPAGPLTAISLWPTDALTSRLIASMFLAVAGAAWMARHSTRLGRTVFAFILVYGLGVCLAGLANLAADKPLPAAYLGFWAAAATAAAFGLTRSPGHPAS